MIKQFSKELTYAPYDGTSDVSFNIAHYNSVVSQYKDYTSEEHAIEVVNNFLPNKEVLSEAKNSLAAYLNGRVIGLITVDAFRNTEYLVSRLDVLPEFRREGVGSRLLKYATEGKIPCGVYVSVYRKEAQEFYLKNGFVLSEETMLNLYGLEMDFVFMQRM